MTDVVETACSLIRIPSVNPGYDPASPGEANVASWLLSWAKRHGFAAQAEEVLPNRNNVIISLASTSPGPRLLLNGHTDTVAVDGMTVPPFEARIEHDALWGRGAADMKGPLACMLEAMRVLKDHPERWRGEIVLACVIDEEQGFAGIRAFLESDNAFDFAIVGEPTRFEVVRGCKGCLRFYIRAHGEAAHSSTPEKGRSAITAMARGVLAMEWFFSGHLTKYTHPDLGHSTGSVGLIAGGSGINIVPEFCETQADIRLVPGQSWESTYSSLQATVRSADEDARWEFDPHPLADPPFCLESDLPFVRDVCQATGRTSSRTVSFSCDASKIAAAGIPCVIFGPGDIAKAHTADESIPVRDLHLGVAAYVRIAETLLSPSRNP